MPVLSRAKIAAWLRPFVDRHSPPPADPQPRTMQVTRVRQVRRL
jgi:hypothetical protein